MFKSIGVTTEETTSTLQAELLRSLATDTTHPGQGNPPIEVEDSISQPHVEGTSSMLPSPNFFDWFDPSEQQPTQDLNQSHYLPSLDCVGAAEMGFSVQQQFMAPSTNSYEISSSFPGSVDMDHTLLPHNLHLDGPDLTSLTDGQWERVRIICHIGDCG